MSRIVTIRSLEPNYCYQCKHFEAASVYSPPPRARCWYKANVVDGGPVSAEIERGSFDPFDCGQEARFFAKKEPVKSAGLLSKVFGWGHHE